MCRQIDGCSGGGVGEVFRTKDSVISAGHAVRMLGTNKKLELSGDFKEGSPTTIEHWDLLRSIMKIGPYFNEGEQVAMSTATCIIGTLAAYSGRMVRMKDVLENERSEFYNGWNAAFTPEQFEETEDIPVPPEGVAPVPGKAS